MGLVPLAHMAVKRYAENVKKISKEHHGCLFSATLAALALTKRAVGEGPDVGRMLYVCQAHTASCC